MTVDTIVVTNEMADEASRRMYVKTMATLQSITANVSVRSGIVSEIKFSIVDSIVNNHTHEEMANNIYDVIFGKEDNNESV